MVTAFLSLAKGPIMKPWQAPQDAHDVQVHWGGAGFPEQLDHLIDDDLGNAGDVEFRHALSELMKSHIRKFGPRTYVSFECRIAILYRGHNDD